MADFVVVPANVLASAKSSRTTGIAGAAIAAGDVLAKDTDNTMKEHDANGVAPLNVVAGIALHTSAVGQPITYVTADQAFTPGFALTVAQAVIASATPGKMCPDSDKASGWFVTELGRAISTTQMRLAISPVGVAIP